MRAASCLLLGVSMVSLACGSADGGGLTGGDGVRPGSGGGTVHSELRGGGPSMESGGGLGAGGAPGASGGSVSSGGEGGHPAEEGGAAGQGGLAEFGGAPGDGGGSSGGAPPLTTLPSGGIVSPQCSACANQHCPAEVARCGANPGCVTAERCITTCDFNLCANCVIAAPLEFASLFAGCVESACPMCPQITRNR